MSVLDVVFAGLATPSLACATYLLVLAAAASRRVFVDERDGEGRETIKFCIVVPAHDEEGGIASTVKSLASIDHPEDARRIVVVADNCSDATAARAREAGATVLVRTDTTGRGKGYALAHAFEKILDEGWADAVVVIDADTVVSPSLLHAFAQRIHAGAHAMQADYAVRNREASWRTRLMVIALALFHVLRSLGRERLGLSAGLRGNGMAFTTRVLREVPHDAFSIVEDLEYGIRLGLAGHRVWYASEAHVYGEMVAGESASRSQRRRWEQGRAAIVKQYAGKLLAASMRKRSAVLFDLAMDVMVPPLSTLVLVTLTGAIGTFVWWTVLHHALFPFVAWATAVAFIGLYVLRGWMLSGVGARGLLDLCWAPVYVIWKLGLALRRPAHKKDEWVRTARAADSLPGGTPDPGVRGSQP